MTPDGTAADHRWGQDSLRSCVGLLLAASASAAIPPDLTDTFDSGDDGWSIYEGGTIGPADWTATGGNTGGFLSYDERRMPTAGDAAFGDAGYVAHLSRYFGRARIVADLRSTAAAAGRARSSASSTPPTRPSGSISSSAGATAVDAVAPLLVPSSRLGRLVRRLRRPARRR